MNILHVDVNSLLELKNHFSDTDVCAFTQGELTVESRSTRLHINRIPKGRFDLSTAFGDDLDERGCSVLTRQLESGLDITFLRTTGISNLTRTRSVRNPVLTRLLHLLSENPAS